MYESFYGLNSKPFQLNPDPGFYFGSKQHRRAKAYLDYGVQRNEGFIVITGEIGAGKTTLVRGLLASLDPEKVLTANLVTTHLGAEDTLRLVGAAFGVRVREASKAEVLMALEAYLVKQASQGKRCLLVVDEAQNLSSQAVEELRMLSNFQYGQQALLQTFLVGQPEFRAILQSPNLQQFRQRVTATCHIGPMDAAETQGYIEHRLKHAGSTGRPTFQPAAFEGIFASSGGIPRRINMICDRLLLLGFLGNRESFGGEEVQEVVRDIQAEHLVPAGKAAFDKAAFDKAAWVDTAANDLKAVSRMDVDPDKLQIPAALCASMTGQLERLSGEQFDARLRRLEGSVLRLERINLETLAMLKKLVSAVTCPAAELVQ